MLNALTNSSGSALSTALSEVCLTDRSSLGTTVAGNLTPGLLLLRVRDELRMTLHAYQTLYESSIAFGVRKALQAEQVRVPGS